jgi:hypothetical protein
MIDNQDSISITLRPLSLDEIECVAGGTFLRSDQPSPYYDNHAICVAGFGFAGGLAGLILSGGLGSMVGGFLGTLYGEKFCPADGSYGI